MPMSEPDQRGGMIADNPNCVYCTDEQGKLKPYEAVLGGMPNRRAYFCFIEIWPQEVYYLVGILILAGLGLFCGARGLFHIPNLFA